jgi:hypothetical protein
LPSSLTRVLSLALVYSTRLPVSVCGTGTTESTLRGFSWQLGSTHLRLLAPTWLSGSKGGFSYLSHFPNRHVPESNNRAGLPCCVPPSLICSGAGILTCCPSPTLLSLGLGPPNPTRTDLPLETLDLRRTWFSHVSRYSCRHSHFCRPQRSSRYVLCLLQNAPLPTHPLRTSPAASVPSLSPVTFSAQDHLTSELLRTL